MFPNPLSRFVEAVDADGADGGEAVGWAEAAGGDVALFAFGGSGQSLWMGIGCGTEGGVYLVLDWLVATGWGEVLGHGCVKREESWEDAG